MTTLENLCADVFGPILDLLQGDDLYHLFACGAKTLNSKINASVRHFTYTYTSKTRATWPKLLTSFSALESLSLSVSFTLLYMPLSDVDIMSLSPTLRHLDLKFCNAFLSLLELPPEGYTASGFVPSVRSDIRTKFSHLKTLKTNWMLTNEMREWDFLQVLKELSEWTEVPFMSLHNYAIHGIEPIYNLPDATKSITITLPIFGGGNWRNGFKLPANLESLQINNPNALEPRNLIEFLPTSLKFLQLMAYGFNQKNFALSTPLPHLTSLYLDNTTCDKAFVAFLPKSLTHLAIQTQLAELESLAVLPPNLTNFSLIWQKLKSSTTREFLTANSPTLNEELQNGLSDDFLPDMRDSVVLQLPRGLRYLHWQTLRLIRPKDWDALPRGLQWSGEEQRISITPSSVQYAHLLPFHISSLSVRQLEVEDMQKLPSSLTSLDLDLSNDALPESLRTRDYVKSMLRSLARFRNLISLSLKIGGSFDAGLFFEIGAQVEKLSLELVSDGSTVTESGHQTLATRSLERLRVFNFNRASLRVLHAHWSCILPTCLALETIHCRDVDAQVEQACFPVDAFSALPPKLTSLVVPMDTISASLFPTLPQKLKTLDLHASPSGGFELEDIRKLPKTLQVIALPGPAVDMDRTEATKLLDDMIPSRFALGTAIAAGFDEVSELELYHSSPYSLRPEIPSMDSVEQLVRTERESRQARG